MNHIPSILAVCLLAAATCPPVACGDTEVAVGERDSRIDWWRDARFGMFVHWGLYSGLAGEWNGKSLGSKGAMEWIQQKVKADTDTYAEQALPLFQPKEGFAKQWARLAKQAGCKYLVFTTKHHEGFALHDSAVTEFDAGSVLNRDLVREIVEACRAEGLKIGFYHSTIDWHHDQFTYAKSSGIPHPLRGQPYPNGQRDHQEYIRYLHSQADELFSNYGPIDIVWWDYSAQDFEGEKAWGAFELMDMLHRKQPAAISNNRLFKRPEAGWSGLAKGGSDAKLSPEFGDFMTPEQHVPASGIPNIYWETCMTMNTSWGYNKHDNHWKSSRQLVETLIETVSKGGNLLLNVGPMADGSIPEESVVRMHAIGGWLETNGESIYGATASSMAKPEWGRVTSKPDKGLEYLHVLEWPKEGTLQVEGVSHDAACSAEILGNDGELSIERSAGRLEIELGNKPTSELPIVVRLRLGGSN